MNEYEEKDYSKLYTAVTFALIGGGIGMLIGSYIASRRLEEVEEVYVVNATANEDGVVEVEAVVVADDSESDIEPAPEDEEPEITIEPLPFDEDEFDLIMERYGASDRDIQMYRSKLVNKETTMVKVTKDVYIEAVKSGLMVDKPDLDEILEEHAAPEARFNLLESDPRADPDIEVKRISQLKWKTKKDRLVRIVGGNRESLIKNPDDILGEGTIDTVIELIMFRGWDLVYVYDRDTQRAYSITLDTEE